LSIEQSTSVLGTLRAARIFPIIRTRLARHAAVAVQWLRDSGIRVFEITLTTPDALSLIRELASDPGLLIGAGTVPDATAAEACLDAGARFIVAPWVDSELAKPCRQVNALLILGALTPTEVRAAVVAGAGAVKIFPVASVGGPAHVKALRSVFPKLPLCPTGGVGPNDVGDYSTAGADFVGIGGSLVDPARIAAGDRAAIQTVAQTVTTAARHP
jgi:2-dehydro-3-deoxyphosphogluconate aldolase/(4S)-4-hydroxy-2-oxoglutarate aldolase